MTEALARVCARHPWRVIAAWAGAIVVAVGLVATLLPGSLSTEGRVTNNPESLRAADLLAARVLRQEGFSELVIVRSERFTVSDPAFRSDVRRLATAATSNRAIAAAALYYQNRDPSLVSARPPRLARSPPDGRCRAPDRARRAGGRGRRLPGGADRRGHHEPRLQRALAARPEGGRVELRHARCHGRARARLRSVGGRRRCLCCSRSSRSSWRSA